MPNDKQDVINLTNQKTVSFRAECNCITSISNYLRHKMFKFKYCGKLVNKHLYYLLDYYYWKKCIFVNKSHIAEPYIMYIIAGKCILSFSTNTYQIPYQ